MTDDPNDALGLLLYAEYLNPTDTRVLNNIGNKLLDEKEFSQSRAYFKRAITINPRYALAYANVAASHFQQGRAAKALKWSKRCVEMKGEGHKGLSHCYVAYGGALMRLGREQESIEAYEKAAVMNPTSVSTRLRLAEGYENVRAYARAKDILESVLQMGADGEIRCRLALLRRHVCDFSHRHEDDTIIKESLQRQAKGGSGCASPWHTLMIPFSTPAQSKAISVAAGHRDIPSVKPLHHLFAFDRPPKALSVVYIGCNYQKGHPTGSLLEGFWNRVGTLPSLRTTVYWMGSTDAHEVSARMESAAIELVRVQDRPIASIAEAINRANSHVCVETEGWQRKEVFQVLSYHPCFVQVSWLAHPGTTGLDFVEYFPADAVSVPIEYAEQQFSEKLFFCQFTIRLTTTSSPMDKAGRLMVHISPERIRMGTTRAIALMMSQSLNLSAMHGGGSGGRCEYSTTCPRIARSWHRSQRCTKSITRLWSCGHRS